MGRPEEEITSEKYPTTLVHKKTPKILIYMIPNFIF